MNPLFFGSSERPLFGVYHPPKAGPARSHGVVLCYPFGHEYMRAHRAFRQLSLLLSRSGFPVFRFDYSGTGDSAGDAEAGDLVQWGHDIGLAIDELKETASIDRVSLVGLRLGAALALLGAPGRTDLQTIVLWDPIVCGAAYLDELLTTAGQGAGAQPAEHVNVNGFPLSPQMRTAIARMDLLNTEPLPAREVFLVVARERDDYLGLRAHLERGGARVTYANVPAPDNWNEADRFGSVLLPQQMVRAIVDHLSLELAER